ncbi:MAG: DUF3108 domain-containing protein [Caulobacteraceae bacterium]|nr:DUF3108 domain-containing protein [Caulobacteraceae bacterium]
MRAVLAFAALLFLATPAFADRFALSYDGFGLGFVPVGGVTVDADVTEDSYDISASLQSRGILNLFERTDIQASSSGAIDANGVRWQRYNLDHHYSRKRRVIVMTAGDDRAISAEIEPNYRTWGDPAATEAQRRASRDPLSNVVAMAIDVGRSRRCEGTYPTFDGRFHYLLQLSDGDIDELRRRRLRRPRSEVQTRLHCRQRLQSARRRPPPRPRRPNLVRADAGHDIRAPGSHLHATFRGRRDNPAGEFPPRTR